MLANVFWRYHRKCIYALMLATLLTEAVYFGGIFFISKRYDKQLPTRPDTIELTHHTTNTSTGKCQFKTDGHAPRDRRNNTNTYLAIGHKHHKRKYTNFTRTLQPHTGRNELGSVRFINNERFQSKINKTRSIGRRYYSKPDQQYVAGDFNERLVRTNSELSADRPKQAEDTVDEPITREPSSVQQSRVLLVTTYRGGSTFLGEIFAQNPDCFYWFEPLIGFDDILHQQAQMMRKLDDVVENVYIRKKDGHFMMLPSQSRGYRHVAMRHTLNCSIDEMSDRVKFSRFTYRGLHMPKLQLYSRCLHDHKRPRLSCLSLLERACTGSSIVAAKTIRLPLYSVRRLLEEDPQLRVIYYIRDPRGVVSSRHAIHHYAPRTMVRVGLDVCQKLDKDQSFWEYLTRHFPEQVMHLRYEDLAAKTAEIARDIYRFIGRPFPLVLEQWIKNNTQRSGKVRRAYGTKRNSTATASKWRTRLPTVVVQNITRLCRGVLDSLGYDTQIH